MQFLSGLWQAKRTPLGSPISRVIGGSPNSQAQSGIPQQQWDIDKAIKDGIDKVIWAFRCVDAIASNATTVPFNVVRGFQTDGREVLDEPRVWKLLNYKPNTYESAAEFRYRLSAQMLLSRRGAFIEMVKGNDNRVSELHLLPANKVEPIPGSVDRQNPNKPIKFVDSYKITDAYGTETYLPPEKVIWIRWKPHPVDPYLALTPFLPASLAIEQDYFARLFNNTFMRNDGRPSMIVSVQGQMNPVDAEELKRRFTGNPATAGQVSVIEANGLEIADFTGNPRDVQWLEGIKASKDDILLAFGVPESVMGNASGRTFDNADAEYEMFWVHTMKQHVESVAYKLDPVTGNLGDDVLIAGDFTKIDVLQRAYERKRSAKAAEFAAGLCSIDDYFAFVGREPWNVVGTSVLFTPSGLAIAKTPEMQAQVTTLQSITQPAQPNPEDAARNGAYQGIQQGQRQWANMMASRAMQLANKQAPVPSSDSADIIDAVVVDDDDEEHHRKVCPYEQTRLSMEGAIDGIVLGWSARYGRIMSERLLHTKVRRGTRHWEDETEQKDLPKKEKCKYCKEQATKRIIHSEGMAYIPVCNTHVGKGKTDAAACIPGGGSNPKNIDRIASIKSAYKALNARYIVQVDQWAADLSNDISAAIQGHVLREAQAAARDLANNGIVGDNIGKSALERAVGDADAFIDHVMGPVRTMVREAAVVQSEKIITAIEKMDKEGQTLDAIKSYLAESIGNKSTWRKGISIGATTSALEMVRSEVYATAGKRLNKEWNAEEDERTRPSHAKANGQTVKADRKFRVGKSMMEAPGDPSAPIGERINCRCWTDYSLV